MIKKYNQFVKDKTNEEFVFDNEVAYPDVYSGDETTTKPITKPDVKPGTDTRPVPPSLIPDEGDSPLESPAKAEYEVEEEEGGDIYSNKLRELADALGAEVTDNYIEYNGKKIMFPSETEKYQIEGVKKGFNTVEEVLSELEKENKVPSEETEEEFEKFESKSYKHTRLKKFKK